MTFTTCITRFVGVDTETGISTWDIDLCNRFSCASHNDAMVGEC